jgi:MFS family permease
LVLQAARESVSFVKTVRSEIDTASDWKSMDAPTRETISQVPSEGTSGPRRVVVGELGLRHTFRALRHRNFRLFISGQLISLIGTWMEQTAMGWLVYQLTNSTFLLGAVAAAGSAPMLFFSMWGGSLADRHPKRSILVMTQTAAMFFAFVIATLVWLGHVRPWQIIAIATLNGIAMGFDMPARQAFIIEMTSREDLLNAISLNSSIFNGARLLGPAIAGFTLARTSAAVCFFINGASFIAVIISLLLMRLPAHKQVVHTGSAGAHALGGLSYVWNHARVLTILTLFGVVGIFGWSYAVLMPAFARDVLHLGADGYGAMLSASGCGALFGALAIASFGQRFRPRVIALNGVWFFSVMLLLFAFTRNFHLALIVLALASFGMMLFFSTSNTTVQQIVPDEMRGRVMGVWSVIFGAMIPLGGLEAGTLARWVGAPATITFGAVVCAIAALVTLIVVRRRESSEQEAKAV